VYVHEDKYSVVWQFKKISFYHICMEYFTPNLHYVFGSSFSLVLKREGWSDIITIWDMLSFLESSFMLYKYLTRMIFPGSAADIFHAVVQEWLSEP